MQIRSTLKKARIPIFPAELNRCVQSRETVQQMVMRAQRRNTDRWLSQKSHLRWGNDLDAFLAQCPSADCFLNPNYSGSSVSLHWVCRMRCGKVDARAFLRMNAFQRTIYGLKACDMRPMRTNRA